MLRVKLLIYEEYALAPFSYFYARNDRKAVITSYFILFFYFFFFFPLIFQRILTWKSTKTEMMSSLTVPHGISFTREKLIKCELSLMQEINVL